MRVLCRVKSATAQLLITVTALIVLAGCTDETRTPVEAPEAPDRRLQLAFDGEAGVLIKINNENLTDPNLASRLRVDITADGPTFAGDNNNKTVQIGPLPTQASGVC